METMTRAAFVLILSSFAAGCMPHQIRTPSLTATPADEKYLLLIQQVPLDLTYEEVKKQIPTLGKKLPEGGSDVLQQQGLTEASTKVSLFNSEALLEFNFKNDKLYSTFFSLSEIDCDASQSLYQQLQKFYSSRFGKASEESETEEGYPREGSSWSTKNSSIILENNIYDNSCTLSWGFQTSQPQ
ncbi:MAG: hypothetical protein HY399_02040 [Elusimicrobia bacterium]|nr:hypothetical protein [Elusimicrobiota bacterium]